MRFFIMINLYIRNMKHLKIYEELNKNLKKYIIIKNYINDNSRFPIFKLNKILENISPNDFLVFSKNDNVFTANGFQSSFQILYIYNINRKIQSIIHGKRHDTR